MKTTDKPSKPTKPDTPFWDQEMLIGYINSDELHKTSVSLCEKDGKKFVSLTSQFRTKSNPNFRVRNAFAIPFQSAQQVAALIERGVREGKKLMW